jgi:hypothetical protein
MKAAAALLLAGAALLAVPVSARPFVPADDGVVVERLPYRPSAAERERRKALARRPSDLALALRLARDALQRARRLGDPRELGQAQAALAPWWAAADAPPPVRLLRATIRQSEHDFSGALDDLGTLIDGDGATGVDAALRQQALLTRAGVQQVLGRLEAAGRYCRALADGGGVGALYGEACLAELTSLTGGAAGRVAAATRLDALDRAVPGQRWLVLMRAELAERMGDARAAEAFYRQVAGADDADVYTVAAYADWLLAHGRGADAARLLQRQPVDADALALRRVLAAKACAAPDAAAQAQRMQARFDAARLRGPSLHLREEALLALDAFGDAVTAWRLAQEQWQRQKEPADALLYVRAAIAAGERARAQALAAQLRAQGWRDERITQALEGSPT